MGRRPPSGTIQGDGAGTAAWATELVRVLRDLVRTPPRHAAPEGMDEGRCVLH
jgi:hypothetical protein